jgi:hypothetical protein
MDSVNDRNPGRINFLTGYLFRSQQIRLQSAVIEGARLATIRVVG